MVSKKIMEEYRQWMLVQGFSLSTIRHALTFIPYLEEKGLDMMRLTEEKALDFFIKAREQGVKLGTINGWVRQIKRWARFRGIPMNIQRYRSYTLRDIQYIPDEKVREILSLTWPDYVLNLRNKAILWVLFSTGIRVSELVSLNWGDIEWDRKLIYIRSGKGGKSRKVPVPQTVMDLLRRYRKVQYKTDPYAVFTSKQGRITDTSVRRIVKEAGTAVGLPWLHPHSARHWRAKNLLQQGVNLNVVQKILGHSNIKTTSLYLEATYQEVVMDVDKKDNFFKKGVKT